MVTHMITGKVEMRVVGSLLESGVGLYGISILMARYRRMDECLRYPEIRRGSWRGRDFTGDGIGLVGQIHRYHTVWIRARWCPALSTKDDERFRPIRRP